MPDDRAIETAIPARLDRMPWSSWHLKIVSALGASWLLYSEFFVASSGASAAYLTVSEIFPLETRALAIAVFYAIGTLIGGVAAPLLFGVLIAAAVLMVWSALCEWTIGVAAEGESLEAISQPIQSGT